MAIIQTRVRLKKDTTEEWEDNGSLVLLDGEMAIEGNRNYKIGDGITQWKNLPYANSNPVLITSSSITLNASHAECFLSCNTSIQITIPSSFVPVGTQIEIYNDSGNAITLLAGAGVTINGKLTSTIQYEVLTLKQVSTNIWLSYTNVSSESSEVLENKDVNFRDYDGTLLYSYSKSDFLGLAAMPPNPEHEGLMAQGWNWTLADAQSYVNACDKLDIGQMYITDDGKTRLYVHLERGRLHPYIGFGINGTATIDWGDGTTSTVTGSSATTMVYGNHEYAHEGDYIVAINGNINIIGNTTSGSKIFNKDTSSSANPQYVYLNCVKKIELGNIYGISNNAFRGCCSLASITIPNSVTSIGSYAFYYCYSLTSIIIPDSVTSINTYAFQDCYSLALVMIPNSVTSISGYVFYYCYSLASIAISNGVTSIGNNVFQNCRSLASITIPSNVTSIGNYAFNACYGLGEIHFKRTTPPSISASNAWTNVPSDCKVYVPQGTLSTYTSTRNYPSPSTYDYIEE